jgi:hypothetical protein
LKNGRIKNETEYYLVNGVLVDNANSIADEERVQLQRLVDEFENAIVAKRP